MKETMNHALMMSPFIPDKLTYPIILDLFRRQAFETKRQFLEEKDFRLKELLQQPPNLMNYNMLAIMGYSDDLVFFADSEVKAKFIQAGFPHSYLERFVDIDLIEKELNRLELQNIFIFRNAFYILLYYYKQLKAVSDTALLFNKVVRRDGNNSFSQFKQMLIDCCKRIDYAQKSGIEVKSGFDTFYAELLEYFDIETGKTLNVKKLFLKMYDGKVDKFILPDMIKIIVVKEVDGYYPFNDIRKGKKVSKNKVLSEVYDLFRLFLQGHKMLTKDEYNNDDAIYKNNYSFYKASRMKKIIYKK